MTIALAVFAVLTACESGVGTADERTITVDVIGDDFNWYFKYAGADGEMGTADDKTSMRHLYLPTHSSVTLNLHSVDYLYSFVLPDFEQSSIAVPGLEYSVSFKTGREGTYALQGDQFCGFSHETLIGEVRVSRSKDSSLAEYFAYDYSN